MSIRKFYTKMRLKVWISVVIIFLQFGCSPRTTLPNLEDNSGLLSEGYCSAPCYLNMIPGVTTKEQVLSILREQNLEQNCQEYDYRLQSGSRGIFCQSLLLAIIFQDQANIVESIGFKLEQKITIEEIINKYGEPNAVIVTLYNPPYAYPFKTDMTIRYDSITTCLILTEQESNTFDLRSTTLIERVGYFSQDSYQGDNEQYSQEWHGYGVYEDQ